MNVIDFSNITLADVALVGGKNASLGELFCNLRPLGVNAVDGFAVTAQGFRSHQAVDGLDDTLSEVLYNLDPSSVESLTDIGKYARAAILATPLPLALVKDIEGAYDRLCARLGYKPSLAVRSSATAEDLPGASFAGQHQTYLNVRGKRALLDAVHACFASLYTDRAIDYRARNGFEHASVALSVGVQPMVRSDLGSAGVIFTLDTESGFRDAVELTGTYGLGELIVQGSVNPDEWTVFKTTLESGHQPIIGRRLGSKEEKLVFSPSLGGAIRKRVNAKARAQFCISDAEVLNLSRWACQIEEHYSRISGTWQPMDIEWAKDGRNGELYIIQARPETVHSRKHRGEFSSYALTAPAPKPLITGQAVGQRIATGTVRVVLTPKDLHKVQPSDILVAVSTDPDWEPIMKRVGGIITDQGGRTAHAAIISREFGVPGIVGTQIGTQVLKDGDEVTIDCAQGSEGRVYSGRVAFSVQEQEAPPLATKTKVMVNLADPSKAFATSFLPNAGVGLARMEFIITNTIGIHPMALCRFPALADHGAVKKISKRLNGLDPEEFFVQRLSEGIGMIAAAFYPKPVIVRTSDFKTNEYAQLLGGAEFEPREENPMLGFRGASRYYDSRYAEGFALECRALSRVRKEMGLTNVKVMIPFCRTVDEAREVVAAMASNALRQGETGLEIYGMCELPSNVLEADLFLQIFDGYSIGSNDLTQLTLGVDRDAGTISNLFDERDPAVKNLIEHAIRIARLLNKPIGICGQAPSDYPELAQWLVEQGISSISLSPDSVLKTIPVIAAAESGVPVQGIKAGV